VRIRIHIRTRRRRIIWARIKRKSRKVQDRRRDERVVKEGADYVKKQKNGHWKENKHLDNADMVWPPNEKLNLLRIHRRRRTLGKTLRPQIGRRVCIPECLLFPLRDKGGGWNFGRPYRLCFHVEDQGPRMSSCIPNLGNLYLESGGICSLYLVFPIVTLIFLLVLRCFMQIFEVVNVSLLAW